MFTQYNFTFVLFWLLMTSALVSVALDVEFAVSVRAKERDCQKYADRVNELKKKFIEQLQRGADDAVLSAIFEQTKKAMRDLEKCEKKPPKKSTKINQIGITVPGIQGPMKINLPIK